MEMTHSDGLAPGATGQKKVPSEYTGAKPLQGGLRTRGVRKQGSSGKPLISVVTVVYNGVQWVERAILSVLGQSYGAVEYIIVDGGSEDGTVERIRQYEERIDYWISEPDGGIYDAMNKGISLATGEIVGLLNADDFYLPETISRVADCYLETRADILFGDMQRVDGKTGATESVVSVQVPQRAQEVRISNVHPASFVARRVYEKLRYNTAYANAADYDFMVSAFQEGLTFAKIDGVLTVFQVGGMSARIHLDIPRIRMKHFGTMAALKALAGIALVRAPQKMWMRLMRKIKNATDLNSKA